MRTVKGSQSGFGALAALLVLVLLATLAAAIVRIGGTQQMDAAQGQNAARATQAANAGIEWGLYQAFKGTWTTCAGVNQTLDLSSTTGMHVTVSCSSSTYNEGESAPGTPNVVRMYTLDAVACNSSACPDNTAATSATYVERRRQVQATN